MLILTILGARPQFIKAAALSRALRAHNGAAPHRPLREVIVHTGQHADAAMSAVFFDQLGLPRPDHHLGIAGLPHGAMTGRMLEAIERLAAAERPDWVLVYGDTNSTLAGALAAAKLGLPLAHVEAGLRCGDPAMPEEVNRVLTDRVATLLLCPTAGALANLRREGYPFAATATASQRIENVGDVMYDALLHYRERARHLPGAAAWGLRDGGYALCTVHRQENTDDPRRLAAILAALRAIAAELPLLLPLHPRTRVRLAGHAEALTGLHLVPPQPYLEMQRLLMGARVVLTDSGGMQKEACCHGVPCVTLRERSEWPETVAAGWNRLAGADPAAILRAFHAARPPAAPAAGPYGDGHAAARIVRLLAPDDPYPRNAPCN